MHILKRILKKKITSLILLLLYTHQKRKKYIFFILLKKGVDNYFLGHFFWFFCGFQNLILDGIYLIYKKQMYAEENSFIYFLSGVK